MSRGLASAQVNFKPMFKCPCGAQALGGQVSFEVDTMEAEDICEVINKMLDAEYADPPVGWEINGRGNYKCPKCREQG